MDLIYAKSKGGHSTTLIPASIGTYKVNQEEIMGKNDKFTMVHNRIIQSRLLSKGEKSLYATLKSFCYDTDVCFPSQELLSEIVGCDPKTLRKYIAKLCKMKLIARVKAKNKSGTFKKTFYKMLPSTEWLIEGDNEVIDALTKANNELILEEDEEETDDNDIN